MRLVVAASPAREQCGGRCMKGDAMGTRVLVSTFFYFVWEDQKTKNSKQQYTHGIISAPTTITRSGPFCAQSTATAVRDPLAGAGFCVARPTGTTFGAFQHLAATGGPQPLAYFPLTGGELSSLTLPEYGGVAIAEAPVAWVNDSTFGSVPMCNRVSYWGSFHHKNLKIISLNMQRDLKMCLHAGHGRVAARCIAIDHILQSLYLTSIHSST